ncbi:phosphoribosylanthranilate isomerase [Pelagovum pacificum]|uniref:N-(5'-phosphoribosyl)anthranilate isomerase n=1 Tax=Pelagovum pacificum TaxID=2588711 RepID=A0A5C5G9T6_9RHOB|nr:phosphoribosylanthranilate isomerase [Pelagovum pacificum]QQA42326.1 phosphoribosylanthranilate isomerase [Pelagovum pacificum]TNY31411.1 phosphoribosylanthranilate isomerase [Pelagovum pacificum]
MPSGIRTKICGLKTPEMVEAAAEAGARYVGFVFFPKSPRAVSIAEAQKAALAAPPGVAKVALVVDPDDALLDEIVEGVPLDMIQLHGKETAERIAEVRSRTGLPVMKSVGIESEGDLASLDAYSQVADQLLVEAKAPKGALPGGNGTSFDWSLLSGRRWSVPWMLAGGLTAENVGEAIRLTGARQVDVSSAVERSRGEKDIGLIRDFLAAVEA